MQRKKLLAFSIISATVFFFSVNGCKPGVEKLPPFTQYDIQDRVGATINKTKPETAHTPRLEEKPISIQEAITFALKNNATLKQAYQDMMIAGDDLAAARSLLLPYISATYAYDETRRNRGITIMGQTFTTGESELFRSDVKLLYTIYDFGKTHGLYKQIRIGRDIGRLNYNRIRQQTILRVVQAYYDVLRAQKGKAIVEESLAQGEAHLKLAQSFERQGMVDKNDVLRAELQVAELKQSLLGASNGLELTICGLNNVLGVNINSKTQVIDNTNTTDFSKELAECLQLAIENREEFKIIMKSIAISKTGITTARAAHLPQIYLAGNYAWSDDPNQKYASKSGGLHQDNLSGELGIKIDIFTGGKLAADVRKAKRGLIKAEEKSKEICNRIALQVKATYLAVKLAEKKIKLTKQTVVQAEENYRLLSLKYKQNAATSTDIVDAEALLVRAKQSYFTSIYDLATAMAELKDAVGGSFEKPIGEPIKKVYRKKEPVEKKKAIFSKVKSDAKKKEKK